MTVVRPRRWASMTQTTPIAVKYPPELARRLFDRQGRFPEQATNEFVSKAIDALLIDAERTGETFQEVHRSKDWRPYTFRILDTVYARLQERYIRRIDASMAAVVLEAVRRALDADEPVGEPPVSSASGG